MPETKKKRPYELIPGEVALLPIGPGGETAFCKIDRVIVEATAVVTVIHNGGRVYICGREQEFDLE